MATQIIRCPGHLLAQLEPFESERRAISDCGSGGISIEVQRNRTGKTAVCVSIYDRRLVWDELPQSGSGAFVLLLTSDVNPEHELQPRPLPDDLVATVIDVFAREASGPMSGHDWVELSSILEQAKSAQNACPLPPLPRIPRSRFERRLCEAAWRLQRRCGSALHDMDHQLESYGEALLRSGVGPVIERISTAWPVAHLLKLAPGNAPNRLSTVGEVASMRRALWKAFRRSQAAWRTIWWVADDLNPCGAYPRREMSSYQVQEIFRFGCADPVPDWGTPIWRRHETNTRFRATVPALGVEIQVERLVRAFDRRLLVGYHPVIRAALAGYLLAHLDPFGADVIEVAGLTFCVLLREMGLPPLPIMNPIYRQHAEIADTLEGSLRLGQADPFVEAMVEVTSAALRRARSMIIPLGNERRRLARAAVQGGRNPGSFEAAVAAFLSTPLIPFGSAPEEMSTGLSHAEPLGLHLHRLGLIDLVDAGGRTWWSLPLARNLLSHF